MTQHRIQRQRTKGWRMPEGAIYVGRPSRWGNPWSVGWYWLGHPMTHREVVQRFRQHVELRLEVDPGWLEPLRKRDLACWCPLGQYCHADVLLELANR